MRTSTSKKSSSFFPFVLVLFFLFFRVPCFAFENPSFVKIKDWHIEKIGSLQIIISAKAVYYNPNKVKAKLSALDLNAFVGETKLGKIEQLNKTIKIKKEQAFEIPLRIDISPETSSWNYIQALLNGLSMNDFILNIRGRFTIKAAGVPIKISLDEKEELNLKMLFN
ncbi:MAG: LEA type 2 family protein [Chitinophagales bacterium]|nr:LEA type 2 family protein [Bacteroidota bacterium]MCB9255826.1 LEA type 2 family protein [Chitinophagales bacterium]